jgi:hypothetical protein
VTSLFKATEAEMDRKNVTNKRNERPNDDEEERAEKGGLKTGTKSQGLKPDASKLPEEEPIEVESDDEEADDDE